MSQTDIVEFVKRPGLGKVGKPTKVRANFFEIKNLPDDNIHQYDITITPQVPPALNKKVFKEIEQQFGRVKPVYDGRNILYSAKPLPFGDARTFDNVVTRDPQRTFTVKIRKVAEIYLEEVHRFLNGRLSLTNNIKSAIMALDVLVRHKASMIHAVAGRSFFTKQGSQPLNGGIEVWQGYYQSARPTQGKMMINIDLSATAFYESGRLVDIIVKMLGKRSVDDLRRMGEKDPVKILKFIKNLKIYVTHLPAPRRRWKINGITDTPASNTMFDQNGQQIDVATYFYNQYNIRLNCPFLPCVVVRRDTYYPMEVCMVIEGQRYIRKLDERQTADMIKFTCQSPNTRANKINQGLNVLNYRQNDFMRDFGLEVSNDMAVVQARILPPPRIQYHPSSRDHIFAPREGVWNLREKKVATGATLGSWACAVFGSERDYPRQVVQHFLRELVVVCQDTGMNILNRTPPINYFNPQGNIEAALKEIWLRAGNAAKAQPQLIVCILPNTGVPLYAEIKRVGDTVIGVATQCAQGKHMSQAKKQYCANLCLKMNVKLGGMNSFIEPALMPFITQCPTILMGADVTHPTPGETSMNRPNRPSIAALCASMDAKASRYAASIRVQAARQEVIQDLAGMVKEVLKTFYQTCNRKPDRILFYRDGVSEGQFAQVLESELLAIKAACRALEEDYKPTITFVVVQKRHHARFFPISRQECDRSGNCLPGTVVETDITHPFEFDFYLQSHAGIQGTSRPTHYHVLYDDNGFTPDSLQALSYNLCYIYARCTRAVSRVPPVYYAHLVSSRARFHASNENWSDPDSEGPVSESYGQVKADLQRVMYYM